MAAVFTLIAAKDASALALYSVTSLSQLQSNAAFSGPQGSTDYSLHLPPMDLGPHHLGTKGILIPFSPPVCLSFFLGKAIHGEQQLGHMDLCVLTQSR